MVTTADRLALAVMNDMLPQHPQTREDYGFERATTILADEGTRTPGGETMLLGLYIGLLKYRGVLPQQLHQWRRRGVMAEEIVGVFGPLSVHAQGGYYAWFLRHPEVLDRNLPVPSAESFVDASFLRAWRYAGRPATTSSEEIKAACASMPKEEASCFVLVSMLLMHTHPSPSLQLWIDFGFCVCDEYHELELGRIYQELVARSSFSEIVAAYQASTMVALFESKGLAVDQFRHFKEVMAQSARSSLFVWHLKAFVDESRRCETPPGRKTGLWVPELPDPRTARHAVRSVQALLRRGRRSAGAQLGVLPWQRGALCLRGLEGEAEGPQGRADPPECCAQRVPPAGPRRLIKRCPRRS
jgi:hypothetical protein